MVASLEQLNREVKAGGPRTFVIKRNGHLEELEVEREDLIVPDEDAYRVLEFYGVGTSTYEVTFEGETTTKIPLLLRIIDASDAQNKGIFSTSVTFESAGPRSTIGQVFAAILGEPFIGQIDNDFWLSVLGGRFGATFTRKEKADATYMNLVHGSARPVKAKAAAVKAAAPNPFDEDGDE